MPDFGLNQITMCHAPFDTFVETAARLGCVGVEARNDLGRAFFDGRDARQAGREIRAQGLRLLGLSQVQPFNRWSDEIARKTQALIETAQEAGAETISLIPSNDGTGLDATSRSGDLKQALEACLPMLEAADMTALIEPLGFTQSSLRSKSELTQAIDALGAGARFKMVHDTFHHTLAGGGDIVPDQTGIVHISGVSDPNVPLSEMRDEHRGLVNGQDRLGNLGQIQALSDAGYVNVYSFECFAPDVQVSVSLEGDIRASMNFISSQLQQMAA